MRQVSTSFCRIPAPPRPIFPLSGPSLAGSFSIMEFLLIAAVIGLLPAAIAQSKGKSLIAWWLYGAALFIVALHHALMMKSDKDALENEARAGGMKKCPFCAEMIQAKLGSVAPAEGT
jgi:hypothetical protein